MGEDAGRDFLNQTLDVLEYMHRKGCCHRDIKLENILVDNELTLKLTDFGFSTYKKIDSLSSYHGTKTYMAPEIKKGMTYSGKSIDIFSMGVVLFILIKGTFPFGEAIQDDIYFSKILEGDFDGYFSKVKAEELSDELKDLLIQIFKNEGDQRPTIA